MQVEEQVVVFALGRQQYSVGISSVKEVVGWTRPTWVPDAPPMVEGVIDLRGDVIPVVDLARRLGAERLHPPEETRIMIMEIDKRLIGLVVDDVTEVLKVSDSQFTPSSPVTRSGGDPLVYGVLKVGSRLLVLVDPARIVMGTGALALAAPH
jgi:purine-binding chemotaxis protein CheW